jgi:hypothetical protein
VVYNIGYPNFFDNLNGGNMLSILLGIVFGAVVGFVIESRKIDFSIKSKYGYLLLYSGGGFIFALLFGLILQGVIPYKYVPSGQEVTYLVNVDTKEGGSGSFLHYESDNEYKYFYEKDGMALYDTIAKTYAPVVEDESEKPYFERLDRDYGGQLINMMVIENHQTAYLFHVPPGTLSKLFKMN